MAEIRVERKTGLPWWGYVVALLILVAVASVALRGCGTTASTTGALGGRDGGARIAARAGGTANELAPGRQ